MARKQLRLHCGVVVIAPLFKEKHRGAPAVRLDTDINGTAAMNELRTNGVLKLDINGNNVELTEEDLLM